MRTGYGRNWSISLEDDIHNITSNVGKRFSSWRFVEYDGATIWIEWKRQMIEQFIYNFIAAMMFIFAGIAVMVSVVAILIGVGLWLGAWGLVGLALLVAAGGYAWAKTIEEMEE